MCKYCYLGEKAGSKMSDEIGYKAINLAFEKGKLHKDNTLWIDFVGGETFLDFQMLQTMVSYVEAKNKDYGYSLLFSTTTNATIFNQDILNYLIEKEFTLKISIDGDQETHDMNRVTTSGAGSFDIILKNLKYIKEFEERTGKVVQVTNVVTENNYKKYYESLVFLTQELGLRYIDTGVDLSIKWTDEQIAVLEKEIERSFDYFIDCAKNNQGFRWEFADKVVNLKKQERKKFYSCGAGIVSSYVRTDGGVYACPGYLDSSVELGNVTKKIEKERIRKLVNFRGIDNPKCESCDISQYCVEQSCIMQNLAGTGDVNKPLKIFCKMRKLMHKIHVDNEEIISHLVM